MTGKEVEATKDISTLSFDNLSKSNFTISAVFASVADMVIFFLIVLFSTSLFNYYFNGLLSYKAGLLRNPSTSPR